MVWLNWAWGEYLALTEQRGFAGIVYQFGWARQFALVFGKTEVAVTLVLASYMAGLRSPLSRCMLRKLQNDINELAR